MINPWKALSKINPQREDTHRRINSDVFRALAKADLTLSELRVILCIIDLTWGYNKVFDAISLTQINQGTGLSKRGVIYSIQTLRAKRIIHYEPSEKIVRGSRINRFLFNKHYDTWLTSEQACTSEPHCTGAKVRKRQVNHVAHSIEIYSIEIKTNDSPKNGESQTTPIDQFTALTPPPEGSCAGAGGNGSDPSKEVGNRAKAFIKDKYLPLCKELKRIELEVAWGADTKRIKDLLGKYTEDQLSDMAKFYLLSEKYDRAGCGPSIRQAFSVDSINLYLKAHPKEPEKTPEQIKHDEEVAQALARSAKRQEIWN